MEDTKKKPQNELVNPCDQECVTGYDAEPDSDVADSEYNNVVYDVPHEHVAKVTQRFNEDGTIKKIFRARKSDFVHTLLHLNGENFDFVGRGYLIPIYDVRQRQMLLKTARQVEKCRPASDMVMTPSGVEVRIDSLKPGDLVCAMNSDGRYITDKVVGSESNGKKPCLRIKTRLGSSLDMTLNHPLRKLLGWERADRLVVGDKIAALRTVGEFGTSTERLAAMIGLMIGDGHFHEYFLKRTGKRVESIGFTAKNEEVISWFNELCVNNGVPLRKCVDKRTGSTRFYINSTSSIATWLKTNSLFHKYSHEKFLPACLFDLDRYHTRQLLRGLWATDGHCKVVHNSKLDLAYCSTSETLVRQVRILLRKFGIVTVVRKNIPSNRNAKPAWICRVVTRRSQQKFHDEIGPIPGKSFYVPTTKSNSNLDTLPREINLVVREARKRSGHYWKRNGLQSKKLRQGFEYCPTYEKVAAIQEHINDPIIQKVLDSDIIWDEIVSIEEIGLQDTWALQTASETFISDFIVNHNTTYLANNLTVNAVVQPYNKALYVSPSHTQTRQFSNEKLKPAIEGSPLIKKYFQDSSVSTQVFEKGFTNGSYIFLRSAFRSADRTRGISAKDLALDEIQDMLGSEIPVIMECTSHFPDSTVLMAGTPKSLDNPIEAYWQQTTQNEWMVPCFNHYPVHWNFLDERNIAASELYIKDQLRPGPVCNKCMKPLDVTKGRWTSFQKGKFIQGYRIPQLMVPWIITTKDQWMKLLWKRDNYPFGQFYNEVLGISYDNASKPITQDELVQCCSGKFRMTPDPFTQEQALQMRRLNLTAGVDWGEGNDGSEKSPTGKIRNASYTVLTIGYYTNQRNFRVVFIKKYTGQYTDPDFVVRDIARICSAWEVKLVGVDWGHGWGVNNHLVRILGAQKVVQFQYLPKQKERMKWDPLGYKYLILRNLFISELFHALKNQYIEFSTWHELQPFAKDLLSVFVEYVEYQRQMKYDHRPSDPDDFLHSLLYSKLASDVYLGKKTRD